uniref:Uncharacterized protein n=1 Tax=Lotharella globosa TaxID=91324 RepID=A0A7S3YPK2_9EUKA|mmetsp:Transcript_32888/g.63461  ORF Transcript_32888/g.63461 Transcript_32888/m.63461 type:complete len:104 (-) Transcript_32888:196-507(-)
MAVRMLRSLARRVRRSCSRPLSSPTRRMMSGGGGTSTGNLGRNAYVSDASPYVVMVRLSIKDHYLDRFIGDFPTKHLRNETLHEPTNIHPPTQLTTHTETKIR